MPTAVDYTNFLVNYVEVIQPGTVDDQKPASDQTPLKVLPKPSDSTENQPPPGVQPPQSLLLTSALSKTDSGSDITTKASQPGPKPSQASLETMAPHIKKPEMAPLAVAAVKKYHQIIPQYLLDLDGADDNSVVWGRANAVIETMPTPPSLPMFLGKSVLNGSTPMKDDASVLVLPNHTVLNHLATSSIKNKVLATSATTRYKRKVIRPPNSTDPN